jgi:hypothetical protein
MIPPGTANLLIGRLKKSEEASCLMSRVKNANQEMGGSGRGSPLLVPSAPPKTLCTSDGFNYRRGWRHCFWLIRF